MQRLARLRQPYVPSIVGVSRGVVQTGFDLAAAAERVAPALDDKTGPVIVAPLPTEEKFADPFYDNCTKRGDPSSPGLPYVFPHASVVAWEFNLRGGTGEPGGRFDGLGYEYLAGVPNTGRARVRAMRAKIDALGKSSSKQVEPLVDISAAALRKFSLEASRLYREAQAAAAAGDPSKWVSLAKILGVPVDQAKADYAKIVDVLGRYRDDTEQFAQELWKSVNSQVLNLGREVVNTIKKEIGSAGSAMSDETAAAFSSAAGIIPIAGAFVKIIVDTYSADIARRREREADVCAAWNQHTAEVVKKTIALNMPLPLHVLDVFPDAYSCSEGTDLVGWQQRVAQMLYYDNLKLLVGGESGYIKDAFNNTEGWALPLPDQEIISWWWGLANTMMSRPDVQQVFRAMGRDVNGGMFASDEQIMLVAAPVAASYGLDVDEFAVRLWNQAPGWRSRPDLHHFYIYKTVDPDTGIESVPVCSVAANNAMQIQWALLAHKAFEIAEDAKNGKVPGLAPNAKGFDLGIMVSNDYMASMKSSPVVPLGIGAGASLALYLAGMSTGIVLAPISAAILYSIFRK